MRRSCARLHRRRAPSRLPPTSGRMTCALLPTETICCSCACPPRGYTPLEGRRRPPPYLLPQRLGGRLEPPARGVALAPGGDNREAEEKEHFFDTWRIYILKRTATVVAGSSWIGGVDAVRSRVTRNFRTTCTSSGELRTSQQQGFIIFTLTNFQTNLPLA